MAEANVEVQPVVASGAAAKKLPAEAPPPADGFGVHMMTIRNFVTAGLDMKNKGDYESTVSRCPHARFWALKVRGEPR